MFATLLSLAALGITVTPEAPSHSAQRIAQADDPCQNTSAVSPSESLRQLELEQFGIAVMIPENYRAILFNNGTVRIVDPGTYNLFRCRAIGGNPLGRGFTDLLIRSEPMPANQSLEAIVQETIVNDRYCTSSYSMDNQDGLLVQSCSSVRFSDMHAEFWVQSPVTDDIIVIETTCDCPGMADYLTEVLEQTTFLSE